MAINTGLDVEFSDINDRSSVVAQAIYSIFSEFFDKSTLDDIVDKMNEGTVQAESDAVDQIMEEAEEIFYQEAPIWSGNLHDNSIQTQVLSKTMTKTRFDIHFRVGVESEEIGDPANWDSYILTRGPNKGQVGYYYKSKDFRMYPGVDYSGSVDEGKSGHSAGFVQAVKDRFNDIEIKV